MPSPSSSLSVTDVLAIWGAVLSSVAVGWNLYRDWLDRGKLRISASLRRLVKGVDGKLYSVKHDLPIADASAETYVVTTAINAGRRPVMFKSWGGTWHQPVAGKNTFIIVGVDLPKMLREGEYHSEFTNELTERIENVKKISVWDAFGKEWNVSRRGLQKLKQEARDIKIPDIGNS
jgi:hypothetical protein